MPVLPDRIKLGDPVMLCGFFRLPQQAPVMFPRKMQNPHGASVSGRPRFGQEGKVDASSAPPGISPQEITTFLTMPWHALAGLGSHLWKVNGGQSTYLDRLRHRTRRRSRLRAGEQKKVTRAHRRHQSRVVGGAVASPPTVARPGSPIGINPHTWAALSEIARCSGALIRTTANRSALHISQEG